MSGREMQRTGLRCGEVVEADFVGGPSHGDAAPFSEQRVQKVAPVGGIAVGKRGKQRQRQPDVLEQAGLPSDRAQALQLQRLLAPRRCRADGPPRQERPATAARGCAIAAPRRRPHRSGRSAASGRPPGRRARKCPCHGGARSALDRQAVPAPGATCPARRHVRRPGVASAGNAVAGGHSPADDAFAQGRRQSPVPALTGLGVNEEEGCSRHLRSQ